MISQHDFLMNIVETVRRYNYMTDQDPVPTTDLVLRHVTGSLAQTEAQLRPYMQRLSDAHFIFIIHMVKPDRQLRIEQVDGYVLTDRNVISQVLSYYNRKLEVLYERQFYVRKYANGIIRELFNQVKQYNNTPIGMVLNTAIMLQQFDQIAASAPREYTDEWQENKLSEFLGANRFKQDASNSPPDASAARESAEERIELSVDSPVTAGSTHDRQRAVDTEAYLEIENMDLSGKWGDAVQRFGVEFLLRIHFRKYEFNTVRHLVNARRVARERDLVFIRDTIRKLEGRLNADPELRNHVRAMADLQAAVLLKLKMIEMAKRDQQPTEPDF